MAETENSRVAAIEAAKEITIKLMDGLSMDFFWAGAGASPEERVDKAAETLGRITAQMANTIRKGSIGQG